MINDTGIPDNSYCDFCGDEEDSIHHEYDAGWICGTCCDGLVKDWCDHLQIDDPLGWTDWLKLAQPTRIIKVDWSDDEIKTYTASAKLLGLTLEEFISYAITEYAETVLG